MKRVLIIGKEGEVVQILKRSLADRFAIQLCADQMEELKALKEKDLIVVCQNGTDKMNYEVFAWLQEQYSHIPVLVISTWAEWAACKEYCKSGQFDKLYRPVTSAEILNKCCKLLGIGGAGEELEPSGQKRIMLVDDSPLLLRNIKRMLDERYTVFLATSGEQALKMIPKKQPDLILLDYDMPGMDGKKTFEAILDDDSTKDIPVIFLTGVADRRHIYEVMRSHPAGYILKPPDKDRILNTIEEVFQNK